LGLLIWMGWAVRRAWHVFRWVFMGLAVLLVFVMIRAAPIAVHQIRHMREPLPDIIHLVELFGILCIGISAAVKLQESDLRGCRCDDSSR
jgi:hypothetical protein